MGKDTGSPEALQGTARIQYLCTVFEPPGEGVGALPSPRLQLTLSSLWIVCSAVALCLMHTLSPFGKHPCPTFLRMTFPVAVSIWGLTPAFDLMRPSVRLSPHQTGFGVCYVNVESQCFGFSTSIWRCQIMM